jgi:hypothetical protein
MCGPWGHYDVMGLLAVLRHELVFNLGLAPFALRIAQRVGQENYGRDLRPGELAHHFVIEEFLHIRLAGRGAEAVEAYV